MIALKFKSIFMLYLSMITVLAATANNTNPKNPPSDPAPDIAVDFSEGIMLQAQNEILQVVFKDKTIRNVHFKIRDEQGNSYYSGSTHTGTTAPLQISFDTGVLPPGKYFIQMEHERFFYSRFFEKRQSSNEDAVFYEKK